MRKKQKKRTKRQKPYCTAHNGRFLLICLITRSAVHRKIVPRSFQGRYGDRAAFRVLSGVVRVLSEVGSGSSQSRPAFQVLSGVGTGVGSGSPQGGTLIFLGSVRGRFLVFDTRLVMGRARVG